ASICSGVAASPVSAAAGAVDAAPDEDGAAVVALDGDAEPDAGTAPPSRAAGHDFLAFAARCLALYLSSHARRQRGSNSSMKMPSSLQHLTNASECAPSAALPAVIPP